MRLWWISAAALVVVFCAIGQTVSSEVNGQQVEATDSGSAQQTSGEGNKVLIKRRRRLEDGSNESENASNNEKEASPEDTSLPKSTTFVQSRAAMFNRLNEPLLRNRALDTTISKLRSRLGALTSSEEPSIPKKRLIKKIKKPTTTSASVVSEEESSPISIQVPRDHPQQYEGQGNDSMIMIPVPPSQRKPYQPVIMQVTKSNESSTAAPDTKVVTYKLNKMFVPIGIYGKVVGNVEETNTTSATTPSSGSSHSHEAKGLEIRHKGTQSESSEKFTGVKVSGEATGGDGSEEHKWISKDGKSKVKKIRKPKEHSRIADSIDITYDYKPTYDQVSIASERPDVSKISLTTLSPLDSILTSGGGFSGDNRRVWGENSNKNGQQGGLNRMSLPRPMNKDSPGSSGSFLDTIKQTASNIPSFLHKGLTSLSSITSSFNENPFHDDTFTSASEMKPTQHRNSPGVVASIPGGYLPPNQHQHKQRPSYNDYESLEFFRNRPQLFGRGRKLKHPKANSGFRPMTPPTHSADDYYASTPTPSSSIANGRKNQRDSDASGSYESVVSVSPSSHSPVEDGRMAGVPTEGIQSSWKEYLFSSSEFGNSPGAMRSWRNFFGLAPAIEQSSMVNPTYGGNTMDGTRRRSMMMDRQWKTITKKYTKNEIDEAKQKIHKYVSGGPESRADKPSYGGAFDDLLQMFQLWFNVGTGRSVAPLKSYEHIQSEARASSEDWKPISKNGSPGKPLISFSAGISFPTKNPGGARPFGSHYSASPKPFIPHKYGNSLTNHITTLAHNYVGPTHPSEHHHHHGPEGEEESQHFVTSFTNEGADEYVGGEIGGGDGYDAAESDPVPVINKYSKSSYSKGSLKAATLKADPIQESSYHLSSSGSGISAGLPEIDGDDSPYELVPSDVYFKNNRNPDLGEIAGVVKPAGVSDEVVKAHLPPGVAGVPTFTYPSQYRKNPPGSLNKLQKFLTTVDGKPMESTQSYKKRVEAYKKKEQSFMLPQQFYDAHYSSLQSTSESGTSRATSPVEYETDSGDSSSLSTQALNAIQHQQLQSLSKSGIIQQQTRVKTSGDSTSSGVELPANLDPDIAALIRAELDKDDIPQEIRSGFQEAKIQRAQQEKHRNQQVLRQQQKSPSAFQSQYPPANNNRRSDFNSQYIVQHQTNPYSSRQTYQHRPSPTFPLFHFNQNQRAHSYGFHNRNAVPQGGASQQVVQKFFSPIPISPSMMSQTLKGRYQSPVPRYVVELAKKLQRDKDVQGIVRVSTKRGNGPPIEYLYPVRG